MGDVTLPGFVGGARYGSPQTVGEAATVVVGIGVDCLRSAVDREQPSSRDVSMTQ